MPKTKVCQKRNCREPAEVMGYCREHYQEYLNETRERDAAVDTLHANSHRSYTFADPGLDKEMQALRARWRVVCDALNYRRKDTVLKDEADAAKEWCIQLAKELVSADRLVREGGRPGYSLDYTRTWVNERFASLDAGLMSNGVKRPESL